MSSQRFNSVNQTVIQIDTSNENKWYYYHRERKVWVMISKEPPEEVKNCAQAMIRIADILKVALE